MKTVLGWIVACGLACSAHGAEVAFTPARPDPLIGEWAGAGIVAQVFAPAEGRLAVNVLPAFDEPDARPRAVLTAAKAGVAYALTNETGWSGTLDADALELHHGGERFALKRAARPSPTLGARPPAGAVVLFDGRDLAAWATKSGKDWLKESGPATWKLVEGGAMEIVPGADSLISRPRFGDARIHVEFRTLGAPTNSGVYLQTRYEVNINETFGRFDANPGGGLDNCAEARPRVRASRPALEWQTLDIDFTAPRFDAAGAKTAPARATVRLNGVQLYDAQELNPPKGAAGRLGEAPTGPLMLQEHGQPVQFRNIWVVEKK